MHWDKSPQDKPCCSLPTVRELLENKRKRDTLESCSPETFTGLPSPPPVQPSTSSAGVQSSPPDMAVSYQQWGAAEPCYYDSMPAATYEHPDQTYEDSVDVTISPSAAPHTAAPHLDPRGLEEARVFLTQMDYTSQDEDGDTILHIYSAKGLREYAYAAAENLRQVGQLDAKEHKGKTALMVAVTANQPEIVHDLLSLGADVNTCDMNGQTPAHLAASHGFPAVLQVILSSGLASREARNFEGMTALHCAAVAHCASVKATFTADFGNPSPQNQTEESLMCLHILLSAGASLLSQELKSNKTLLHLAVKEGNIELVRFLLKIPLPEMQDFVNMKAHGHTALHMAAGLHGNVHQKEMLQLLLCQGADPSIRNLDNHQPAHLLQSGPGAEQLKSLLKRRGASARRPRTASQDQG